MHKSDFEIDVKNLERGAFPERRIPEIDGYPVTEIRSTSEKLAEALTLMSRNKEDRGGVLRIFQFNHESSQQVFSNIFGLFNPKDRKTFELCSWKKAERLYQHHRHHSSFQSRNAKEGYYGGAIRTSNHHIISCSGMSEHENEALSLCLAFHLRWLTKEEVGKIAEKSENKIFGRLMKTMK